MQLTPLALLLLTAPILSASTPGLTLLNQLPTYAVLPLPIPLSPSNPLTPHPTTALSTSHSTSDIACACSDTSFISSLTTAVHAVRSTADIASTLVVAQKLCASAGVTLTLPEAATAVSTAASAGLPAATNAAANATVTMARPTATAMTGEAVRMAAGGPVVVGMVGVLGLWVFL